MTAALTFDALKTKQRNLRDGFPENLGLRVHRALSWLHRAELAGDDKDATFIFLWIAFNSAYADDCGDVVAAGERSNFADFFEKLIALDVDQRIYDALWRKFSGPIRLLLDNQYVFQPFWNHQNQLSGYADWEDRFAASKRRLQRALAEHDTKTILTTVVDRLYVLRNQLIHGGATWASKVNRAQVTDGAAIMGTMVPLFIDLMMENPMGDWGAPFYPVVD